jgi:hypothetical protein
MNRRFQPLKRRSQKEDTMNRFLLCILILGFYLPALSQLDCRQSDYQQQILKDDPGLARAYAEVENFTRQVTGRIRQGSMGSGNNLTDAPSLITIPVVVHILYDNASQNISDAQVQSQIDELNLDYRAKNADHSLVPAYFTPYAGDMGFQFSLARVDPSGAPTSGIVRKYTAIQYFGLDDRIKASAQGGDDAWDSDQYLNIWVGNLSGGVLGYASLPGGPKSKDGVVIKTDVFGTINTSYPFNRGRTAVHEIGHWLNLRHLWGDADCGDDLVEDTPPQRGPTRGCPSGEQHSCGTTPHGDMYMDYMDFTNDACMFMFTAGQGQRMKALFAVGGPRYALLASKALDGPGLPVSAGLPVTNIPGNLRLAIYPNPAVNEITVQADPALGNCAGKWIYIYNQLGQKVLASLMGSNQQNIGVGALPAGIYLLKLEGINKGQVAKFIKQ